MLDAGTAYVFNAATGALLATLSNPAPAVGDNFGISVAVSGNVAVVGAHSDNPGGVSEAGTAYVFNAATGALVATLSNPAPTFEDFFGISVAISGNIAVIGAFRDDPGGVTNAGTAYVFDATTGTLIATLNYPVPTIDGYFGMSVAVSGNIAVVGAAQDDPGGEYQAGTAFTFNATTGALVATLSNPAPAVEDFFGSCVSVSGNVAIVGVPWADPGSIMDAGTAYVFNAMTGALVATVNNPAPEMQDHFGHGVAVSGNIAVVGAWLADPLDVGEAGTAYSFFCTNSSHDWSFYE